MFCPSKVNQMCTGMSLRSKVNFFLTTAQQPWRSWTLSMKMDLKDFFPKYSIFSFVYLQCPITAQNVRAIPKVDFKNNFRLNWTIWGSISIPNSYILLVTQVSSHHAKFQKMLILWAMCRFWGFGPLSLCLPTMPN